jgi:trimeric autotransporter adhesin
MFPTRLFIICSGFLLLSTICYAQNVAINDNNANADPSAILDVQSNDKGILVPRMNSGQRQLIVNPALGLLVFDTSTESFWFRDSNEWIELKAGLSSGWSLSGNKNTNPNTDFIGTTDDKSLIFKINNQQRMSLDNQGRLYLKAPDSTNTVVGFNAAAQNKGVHNSIFGHEAAARNTTGRYNSLFGQRCAFNNISGSFNAFYGSEAGFNNQTGSNNIALGSFSLYSNLIGSDNTAVGFEALYSNESGSSNTVIGQRALLSNVTGSNNIAIGRSALGSSTVSSCTAVGSNAGMKNTTGSPNSFFGFRAGMENTTGGGNSFFGANSGLNNLTGAENTFLGTSAGDQNTTGTKNVCIGAGADMASANLVNAVALGFDAQVNASAKIRLGNTGISVIEGAVPFTQPSDGRFKSNLTEDIPGLDLIKVLRPVSYNFDYVKFSKFLGEKNADIAQLHQKEQQREMGFIAQEVETACQKAGLSTSNLLHAPTSDQDNYAMSYGQLTVPLVKAVQEQQVLIENQKTEITDLKSQLSDIQQQMKTLLGEMQTIKASLARRDEGK